MSYNFLLHFFNFEQSMSYNVEKVCLDFVVTNWTEYILKLTFLSFHIYAFIRL